MGSNRLLRSRRQHMGAVGEQDFPQQSRRRGKGRGTGCAVGEVVPAGAGGEPTEFWCWRGIRNA